jgi:hypothetical protein
MTRACNASPDDYIFHDNVPRARAFKSDATVAVQQ